MAKANTAPKEKKQPERQCMGCNEKKLKKELIRIVRTPEGGVELDFTGKKSGRGAYICRSVSCLKKIRKTGRLPRILECPVSEDIYAALEEEIEENG